MAQISDSVTRNGGKICTGEKAMLVMSWRAMCVSLLYRAAEKWWEHDCWTNSTSDNRNNNSCLYTEWGKYYNRTSINHTHTHTHKHTLTHTYTTHTHSHTYHTHTLKQTHSNTHPQAHTHTTHPNTHTNTHSHTHTTITHTHTHTKPIKFLSSSLRRSAPHCLHLLWNIL
jgi:hypothetical protein